MAHLLHRPVLKKVVWRQLKPHIHCFQCPVGGAEILVHRTDANPKMIWEALYVDGVLHKAAKEGLRIYTMNIVVLY